MLTDAELGNMVREALDEVDEPAPWLSTVVRNHLRTRNRPLQSWLAPVAAAAIATLLIALFAAIRLDLSPPPTRIGPSQDPAIAGYRAQVDLDLHVVDRSYLQVDCRTRARCVESTTTTRDATLKLLQDLSTTTPPRALQSQVEGLTSAATRFLAQLNTALDLMSNPNSDYVAAGALPDITELDVAAARIDCWPVKPVIGGHGFGCF